MNEPEVRTNEVMEADVSETDTEETAEGTGKDRRKKVGLRAVIAVFAGTFFVGIGYAVFRGVSAKGYQDYLVRKEQYFVEYSEEYDYWDVLTVEYPVLTGVDSEIQEQINEQMYETAMNRVNYWHFHPSDEVKAFQEDEDLKENYESRPFFYVTEDKEFVIGLSLDPVLYAAVTYEPTARIMCTTMKSEELAPFKTQSGFWDKYEKSQTAGEILPCEDKQENIWLGEGASIWDWEY